MGGAYLKLKYRIAERDKWICGLCNREIADETHLSLDHILPKSKGGTNALINLQASHKACNSFKSSRTDLKVEDFSHIKIIQSAFTPTRIKKSIVSIKQKADYTHEYFQEFNPTKDYSVELYNEIIKHGTERLSFKMFKSYFEKYAMSKIINENTGKYAELVKHIAKEKFLN